jgi:hypothetical protein
MKWTVHEEHTRKREREKDNKIFVVKPEGKKPHGLPKCRWVDDIKMKI